MNKWMLFILLLCAAGLSAPFLRSHDAQFYFDRASETLSRSGAENTWGLNSDLNSALADYSRAIRLDPKFTAAYSSRAVVESLKQDWDNAVKDYTSAIELNPQDMNSYLARAGIETAKRDYAHALDDYDRVIKLSPDTREAYRGRMNVREAQNDYTGVVMERVRMFEEAPPSANGPFGTNGGFFPGRFGYGYGGRGRSRVMDQLDRALATNTNFTWGYFYRGVFKSLTNGWDEAAADFQECRNSSDGKLRDYAAIHIWLAQMRAGGNEKARQGLSAYCQNRAPGAPAGWPAPVAKFFLDQITETDFSKAVEPSDTGREQSEFWYYTGMKHLLAGDKERAGDCFRKSLTTPRRSYVAYLSAVAELRELNTEAPAD